MTKNKRYWHDVVGYNYRLTNLQAAIGVAQMERIDSILEKKSLIFDTYDENFTSTNKSFRKSIKKDNTFHSNWLYGIILNSGINRDQMIKELLLHGIETRPFFYPLNEMIPYKKYRSSKELLISKEISRNGLSLPSSNSLEIDDLSVISKTVLQLIKDRYH
jgi:perosamine synthetase